MIRFGSIGWSYDDWDGVFYARGTRPEKRLGVLSRMLSAVEIDATFFGIPRPGTLLGWASQVPEDFRFTAKLPRSITHEKHLAGDAPDEALLAAEAIAAGLGEKLGALLVQLPPELSPAERRHIEAFFSHLSGRGLPLTVELRHAAWRETDIADFLSERGVALATTEKLDFGHPPTYLRLLGEEGSVARFNERQIDRSADLDAWAARLRASSGAFVFIRNYFEGHAPTSLFALMERLGIEPPTPPGQQQLSLF